jgi:flagellar protein FlbD
MILANELFPHGHSPLVSENESKSLLTSLTFLPISIAGGSHAMIEVTRLNGNTMVINSDLIKIAEQSPDTMLTLVHGEKLIVRESCEEIVEKVLVYRARLLAAVAAMNAGAGDLHRIVALASLQAEEGEAVMPISEGFKTMPPKLRVEMGGRQG